MQQYCALAGWECSIAGAVKLILATWQILSLTSPPFLLEHI